MTQWIEAQITMPTVKKCLNGPTMITLFGTYYILKRFLKILPPKPTIKCFLKTFALFLLFMSHFYLGGYHPKQKSKTAANLKPHDKTSCRKSYVYEMQLQHRRLHFSVHSRCCIFSNNQVCSLWFAFSCNCLTEITFGHVIRNNAASP